jgi:hypothetical protein
MPYILNKAKTMRNLKRFVVWGSGPYVNWTPGTRVISFWDTSSGTYQGTGNPVPMDIKPGATFYHDSYLALVTIQGGSGNSFVTDQILDGGAGGIGGYYLSRTDTDRGRNSSGVVDTDDVIAGLLVPDAVHYIYASHVDDGGNPDYYVYIDTIQPERGVHPYTRDVAIGSFKTIPRTVAAGKTGRPIMDLATRVRNFEGVLRTGRSAGSSVQDDRLAKLVQRLVAFETWANGAGHFGSPPAVGSSTVYTEDQFVQAGDQA